MSENRTEQIHITFTIDEKKRIYDFAKKSNKSARQFIRDSIFEKINRKENPELFNRQINVQIDPIMIEQLIKNTKKMIELQELTLERTNIMNEMNQTLDLIKKYTTQQGLEKERGVIIDLFKANNSLSKQEIINKTSLDKAIVLSIVSHLNENKIIKLTSRGRFKINE